jgi:hypothetical protein
MSDEGESDDSIKVVPEGFQNSVTLQKRSEWSKSIPQSERAPRDGHHSSYVETEKIPKSI